MTRGMRLLVIFLVLLGVIALMMDCAKRSMRTKKMHTEGAPAPQGRLWPGSGELQRA